MLATLYLVRHATPDWNRTDIRYDIPPGPPLTAQGEIEAQQVGDFLKTLDIAHIYASPLERTRRTAQLIAATLGLEPENTPDIAEWVHGELADGVLTRFRAFVDSAFDASETRGPIALVTHGGPIRVLLADLGLDSAEIDHYRHLFDHDNPVPPAGVWRIRRKGDGQMEKPELVYTPNPITRYVPATTHV